MTNCSNSICNHEPFYQTLLRIISPFGFIFDVQLPSPYIVFSIPGNTYAMIGIGYNAKFTMLFLHPYGL